SEQKKHQWAGPEEIGPRNEWRLVENEVTIAIGHELNDLLIAAPGHDHVVHLAAQILRQIRLGSRDALPLAYQASKLPRQHLETLCLIGIVEPIERRCRVRGTGHSHKDKQQRDNNPPRHRASPSWRSLAMSG